MTKAGMPGRDPVPIGDVAAPAFVRLPDPSSLFGFRARRFRALAPGHELGPYLLFLADLAACQEQVLRDLPPPPPPVPEPDAVQRARRFAMPPLDRRRFAADAAFGRTLEGMLARLGEVPKPDSAAEALDRVRSANAAEHERMVRAVLDFAIPFEALAEHGYVAAALQVHFARCAAGLEAKPLVPVGDGACPVCGSAPVASMVVGWQGAHGTRYCGCSLCSTLWNYVRIKCVLCASTKGIAYQEIDGGPGNVKAETCESCRGYLKIMQQHKDPHVELVADDVASLALDLLVREAGYRRGGVNPFLVGY